MTVNELNTVKNCAKLLHDSNTVENALNVMAQKINADYANKQPIFMVVMNGGLVFGGKLFPKLNFPAELDYCHATRYRGETSGGEIQWKVKPQSNLKGRHVLIVDDILDEGYTLQAIKDACEKQGALSVKTVVLIEKHHDRKAVPGMIADYCELETPDEYIFGYGMDYNHYWRNTDEIYILNQD